MRDAELEVSVWRQLPVSFFLCGFANPAFSEQFAGCLELALPVDSDGLTGDLPGHPMVFWPSTTFGVMSTEPLQSSLLARLVIAGISFLG